MSIEQFAFLRPCDVPSRDRWQAAIDECGFDLRLHESLQPLKSSGFLPCDLEGMNSGFEIYFDRSPETLAARAGITQGLDCCIVFRWSGSIDECASAMVASYALAKAFGAVVSYEGAPPQSLERLLAEVQACLAEARRELGLGGISEPAERPQFAVEGIEASASPSSAGRRVDRSSRTLAAWARLSLGLLQEIHPDYRRNGNVKGRFIEFVRPDTSGLWISQNFIRISDCYYLCFALTLTTQMHARLHHPLIAGSRFDHNKTIWRQVADDLGLVRGAVGYPTGTWSSGEWRSNTMDLVKRGLAVNEDHLLPFYRDALGAGKRRLLRFFQTAERLIPALDPTVPVLAQASGLGVDPEALESYPLISARVDALAIAQGGHCYAGFGPDSNTVDMNTISPDVLVLHFAEELMRERERLSAFVASIKAL